MSSDDLHWALASATADLDPDVERELERVLARAGRRSWGRRAAYVAAVASVVAVAVLMAGQDWRPDARGPEPDPAEASPVHALAPGRGMFEDPAPINPGRYEVTFLGGVRAPVTAEIDVPDGWGQDDRYALATGPAGRPATRRIDVFARVFGAPGEECATLAGKPGPTAVDLARTYASFSGVAMTDPQPVSVGGHPGYLVPMRAPSNLPEKCLRDLTRMVVVSSCLPPRESRGWTSLMYVVDVDGRRLVLNASYGPRATKAQIEELTRMVESATFSSG